MSTGPVGAQRTLPERQQALMRWYRSHGRHHLPWRRRITPYGVLVSEVMLQQTQVDRVIPYWNAWMRRWPTMQALERAKRASVIRAWAGLGYNRRAVNLHRCAQEAVRDVRLQQFFRDDPHPPTPPLPAGGGETKKDFSPSTEVEGEREGVAAGRLASELQRLPGVGSYTANAFLTFAWNLPAPCVDTNVRRVLAYVICKRPAIMRMSPRHIMRLAARVIPNGRGRDWNYALMDYGALVLTARALRNWPNSEFGQARHGRRVEQFAGSSRFWRGRIVAVLRDLRRSADVGTLRTRLREYGRPPHALPMLLRALIRDGVVTVVRGQYRLPTA